jgi:cell division protein FtsB
MIKLSDIERVLARNIVENKKEIDLLKEEVKELKDFVKKLQLFLEKE